MYYVYDYDLNYFCPCYLIGSLGRLKLTDGWALYQNIYCEIFSVFVFCLLCVFVFGLYYNINFVFVLYSGQNIYLNCYGIPLPPFTLPAAVTQRHKESNQPRTRQNLKEKNVFFCARITSPPSPLIRATCTKTSI